MADIKVTVSSGGGGTVTVDDALSLTSENPVQNKVITSALGGKADSADLAGVALSGSYNDLSDKPQIPSAMTVDSALSAVSENPVQNKVITSALNGKQNTLTPAETEALLMSAFPAAMHRNIFRGKYLGSEVTAAQLAAIDDGSFDDLYVGDYWIINDIVWRIADMNYWIHTGDIPLEINHLLIAPDLSLYNEKMNTSGTNSGGYPGSYMYTTGLTRAKTMITTAFPGMVLSHREIFAKSTSAYEWYDSTVDLMNEVMVYGSVFFRAKYTEISQILTVDATQLALFRLNRELIMPEDEPYRSTWLRDTNGSNAYSATSREYGMVTAWDATHEDVGVRPVFAIGVTE